MSTNLEDWGQRGEGALELTQEGVEIFLKYAKVIIEHFITLFFLSYIFDLGLPFGTVQYRKHQGFFIGNPDDFKFRQN